VQAQAQFCPVDYNTGQFDNSLWGNETAPACNTPTNRQCWGEYNINTNYYTTWPTTGVTREVISQLF